uniref:Uncharacterized protein n=1 Tax=viral metagenome TaxID=1070528 RepID=A0A6M3LAP1_9ZZZZ
MTSQIELWKTGNGGDPRRSIYAHFVPQTMQERIAAEETRRAEEEEREYAWLERKAHIRQAKANAELTACPTCGRPCEFLVGYAADDDCLICTNCDWDGEIPEGWHDGCCY